MIARENDNSAYILSTVGWTKQKSVGWQKDGENDESKRIIELKIRLMNKALLPFTFNQRHSRAKENFVFGEKFLKK